MEGDEGLRRHLKSNYARVMSPKADTRTGWKYVNPHIRYEDTFDLERCRTPNLFFEGARQVSDPGLDTSFYGSWHGGGAAPETLLDRFPHLSDESAALRDTQTAAHAPFQSSGVLGGGTPDIGAADPASAEEGGAKDQDGEGLRRRLESNYARVMSPKVDNRQPWTYANPHIQYEDIFDVDRCRTPNIAREMSDPGLQTSFYGAWHGGAAPETLLDRFPRLADETAALRGTQSAHAPLRNLRTAGTAALHL